MRYDGSLFPLSYPLLPGGEQYGTEFLDERGVWLISLVCEELVTLTEIAADDEYLLSVNGQAPTTSPYRAH